MGQVNTTFGAVANGNSVGGQDADLFVSGTFVGTAKLQAAMVGAAGADAWVDIGSLTAPGIIQFKGAANMKFRAICSAWTSGTIYTTLSTGDYITRR